jgi:hypothetical protein
MLGRDAEDWVAAEAEIDCMIGFAEKLMLHEEIQREMSYPTGSAILWGRIYETGYGNYQAIQVGRSAG